MQKIKIFNIPNYYCSFYVKSFLDAFSVKYHAVPEFQKWNGWPLIILEWNGKIIVIDNGDPVSVKQPLYEQCDHYFMTNKLIDIPEFNQEKIKPLFPHYPIDAIKEYFLIFGKDWITKSDTRNWAWNVYRLWRRPYMRGSESQKKNDLYIFFAGSIWKNQAEANKQRAEFITACRQNPYIKFEGGLVPRDDGKNQGFENVLAEKRYSRKEFSEKIARSILMFNNPAVLGAVSWRVAECFNLGTPLLSLPWKIELPVYPKDDKEIRMINSTSDIPYFLDYIHAEPAYLQRISEGAQDYYKYNCAPERQVEYIRQML